MTENFKLTFETSASDEGLCIHATMYAATGFDRCATLHHHRHVITYQQLASAGLGANAVIANVKRDLVRAMAVQLFPED